MAHPEIEAWLSSAEGKAMNPDGHYGLQCVDLADQYGQDNFGVPWQECIGWVTGAKQILGTASDKYWRRIDNDPSNPNQVPPRGALVVFAGSAQNQWGHVAVVLEANASGMWVIQQDGFAAPLVWVDGNWYSDKPAHRAWLEYTGPGTGPLSGWLIPREEKLLITLKPSPTTAPAPSAAANQRITGPKGVIRRNEPKVSTDNVKDTFGGDLILTIGGYVRGQKLTIGDVTTDVWFQGGITGGFMWAGGFTDHSTNGLKDLTPVVAAPTASNKRITGKDGVNRREMPDKGGKLIDTFGADLELTIGGFIRTKDSGPFGDGRNVWFKGGITGGWMWAGGFTDQSTEGLKHLTEEEKALTETPAPVVEVYDFEADFDWVEKIPAALTNVQRASDNRGTVVFPDKPSKSVIHQFGTLGIDTIGSTINEFKKSGTFKSAHFVVSGKRAVQMVSLKDRAYHAGANGNDFVGIETDPLQDPDTIATVKRLIADIKKKTGQTVLVLVRHREIPGSKTDCGSYIDLNKYQEVTAPTTPPVVAPPAVAPPVVTPAPALPTVDANEAAVLKKFSDWLIGQFLNRK